MSMDNDDPPSNGSDQDSDTDSGSDPETDWYSDSDSDLSWNNFSPITSDDDEWEEDLSGYSSPEDDNKSGNPTDGLAAGSNTVLTQSQCGLHSALAALPGSRADQTKTLHSEGRGKLHDTTVASWLII